ATGRKSRSELLKRQIDWRIERANRTDHAKRRPHRKAHALASARQSVERDDLAVKETRTLCREPQDLGAALRLDPRQRNRLAAFPHEIAGDIVGALFEQHSG